MPNKSKNYVLTINNPVITLAEQLEMFGRAGAVKAIAQLERGESGTPHFQCFIAYANERSFK